MPHRIDTSPSGQRQTSGCETPAPELARIWAELVAASRTDIKARQFVDYFRADANRLFGVRESRAHR